MFHFHVLHNSVRTKPDLYGTFSLHKLFEDHVRNIHEDLVHLCYLDHTNKHQYPILNHVSKIQEKLVEKPPDWLM